jgi:hypothetical protein
MSKNIAMIGVMKIKELEKEKEDGSRISIEQTLC